MKKAGAVVVAAVVTAALMTAERESPGATGRGTAELRQAVTPAVAEAVGALGDGVLVARSEAQRQGINPGAIIAPPAAQSEGLADVDPNQAGG